MDHVRNLITEGEARSQARINELNNDMVGMSANIEARLDLVSSQLNNNLRSRFDELKDLILSRSARASPILRPQESVHSLLSPRAIHSVVSPVPIRAAFQPAWTNILAHSSSPIASIDVPLPVSEVSVKVEQAS